MPSIVTTTGFVVRRCSDYAQAAKTNAVVNRVGRSDYASHEKVHICQCAAVDDYARREKTGILVIA
jgi:hypothetical protein